jgi:hypothetical protein
MTLPGEPARIVEVNDKGGAHVQGAVKDNDQVDVDVKVNLNVEVGTIGRRWC